MTLAELSPLPDIPNRPPRYTWRLWNMAYWYEEGFLPLRTVSYGWKRNDVGQLQASLPLQAGAPPVRSGEQAVIVERNGNPVWMGPVWSSPWSTDTAYLQLNGSDWGSLLKRRRVRLDRTSSQRDQFEIARNLIGDNEYWWGVPDPWNNPYVVRALHIDLTGGHGWANVPLSGVLRDRTYNAVERKEIFEMISNLANVINGFDFRFRPIYGTNNEPIILFELFYPQLSYQNPEIVFEYKAGWPGSNVDSYSWNENAGEMANLAEAANDEEVMMAIDHSAFTWYLPMEALDQRGGEGGTTNVDTLQEHANSLLEQRRRPVVSCTFTTVPGLYFIGPELVGSRIRFRATSWMHPPGPQGEPGLDREMTIEEIVVNAPSDERAENATVTCTSIPGGR